MNGQWKHIACAVKPPEIVIGVSIDSKAALTVQFALLEMPAQ